MKTAYSRLSKQRNSICNLYDIAKDGMFEGPSFDLYAKNFGSQLNKLIASMEEFLI
jgi:hypothetical protein